LAVNRIEGSVEFKEYEGFLLSLCYFDFGINVWFGELFGSMDEITDISYIVKGREVSLKASLVGVQWAG